MVNYTEPARWSGCTVDTRNAMEQGLRTSSVFSSAQTVQSALKTTEAESLTRTIGGIFQQEWAMAVVLLVLDVAL